ncbi:sugar phosphate nucleotidyltransferase [Streptomyces shenzhenensis]|uniref:sugar phosphate nucleotidyltransferase n=1 Tax=Streptomyces shenzhenensis TaxID=943815 RepID=UPI0033C40EF6
MSQTTAVAAAPVVIAAGGLGTRVAGWSPYLPKELRPVRGRPGLAHIVDEAGATGAVRAVVVHHPYYTPLVPWTRQVLAPGALARYQVLARQPVTEPRPADRVRVDFIPQQGRYADVTSVLEGAEHLRAEDVYMVFADNVDVTHTALSLLAAAATPGVPAVLASPFDVDAAGTYGVIVCDGTGPVQRMLGLVEKPGRPEACRLLAEHGADSLRLLQGRMRITQNLLNDLSAAEAGSASEPKLSLALAAYARAHPVDVVTTTQPMTDLGLDSGGL